MAMKRRQGRGKGEEFSEDKYQKHAQKAKKIEQLRKQQDQEIKKELDELNQEVEPEKQAKLKKMDPKERQIEKEIDRLDEVVRDEDKEALEKEFGSMSHEDLMKLHDKLSAEASDWAQKAEEIIKVTDREAQRMGAETKQLLKETKPKSRFLGLGKKPVPKLTEEEEKEVSQELEELEAEVLGKGKKQPPKKGKDVSKLTVDEELEVFDEEVKAKSSIPELKEEIEKSDKLERLKQYLLLLEDERRDKEQKKRDLSFY